MAYGLAVGASGNGIQAFQRNLIAIILIAIYARIYWAKTYINPDEKLKNSFSQGLPLKKY